MRLDVTGLALQCVLQNELCPLVKLKVGVGVIICRSKVSRDHLHTRVAALGRDGIQASSTHLIECD